MRVHKLIGRVLMFGMTVVLLVLALAAPAAAQAQSPAQAPWLFGVRGGVSGDPKQVVFGAHAESPQLSVPGHLVFRPAVEIGVGSDATILAGHFDILYSAPFPGSTWSLLFGAGPMIAYEKESAGCAEGVDCGFSETRGGFSAIVGMTNPNGLSIELRTSDRGRGFQAMVGYKIRAF